MMSTWKSDERGNHGPVSLSVQIVTWNSAEVIDDCLDSLARQECRDFEVVVVDNASKDGCADRVAAWEGRLPRLVLIREIRNRGFCGGQNRACAASSGPYVLFLNPDTILPPDFIGSAIAILATSPAQVGAIAPCLQLPDGRIDSTGLAMDRFRRAYDRDRGGSPERRFKAARQVFGCTGAAALLKRDMLEDVEVDGQILDERIFAYYDDLDLAWRAVLRGWTCLYEPSLVATHRRAARNAIRGLPARKTRVIDQRLSVRNRLLVMVRCERPVQALLAAPWLIAFEFARVGFFAVLRPSLLAAYLDLPRELRPAFAARREIHGRALEPSLPPLPWRVR